MRRAGWPLLARRTKKGLILLRHIECDWHRSVARLYAERLFSDPRAERPSDRCGGVQDRGAPRRAEDGDPRFELRATRLQKDLRPYEIEYLDGLAEAIRCQWLGRGQAFAPFSRKYASAVTGITVDEAHKAETPASPSRPDRGRRLPPADAGRGRERQEPDPPLRDLRHDLPGGGVMTEGEAIWEALTLHFGAPRLRTEKAVRSKQVAALLEMGATPRGESRSPTTTASAASTCSARRRSSGTTSRPRQPHDPPHDPTWAEALPRRASADARGDPLGNDGDGRRRGAPSRARSSGGARAWSNPTSSRTPPSRCPAERRVGGDSPCLRRPPGRAVRRGVL